MKRDKVFKFYSDPGHGWLAVKRSEIDALGIADKISAYSYQSKSGETVYLEEDCDASLFFTAFETVHGLPPRYQTINQDRSSPIRSYPRFSKGTEVSK